MPNVAVAVAENERVTVQVGLHGLLRKLAVTPEGRAEVETVTGVVVPLTRVIVADDVGLVEPCTTVRLFGERTERMKSNGGAVTVNDKVVE